MCAQGNLVAWSSPLATESSQVNKAVKRNLRPRRTSGPRASSSAWSSSLQTYEVGATVSQDGHKEARSQEVNGSSRTKPIFLSSTVSPTTRDNGRWDGKGKVGWLYLGGARQARWDPQLHEKCQFGDHLTEWDEWTSKEAFTTATVSKWFFFPRTTEEIFLDSLSLILSQG